MRLNVVHCALERRAANANGSGSWCDDINNTVQRIHDCLGRCEHAHTLGWRVYDEQQLELQTKPFLLVVLLAFVHETPRVRSVNSLCFLLQQQRLHD